MPVMNPASTKPILFPKPEACTGLCSTWEEILIHLLLACLLLMATQWHYSTFTVQATASVHFRFKPAQPKSRSGKKFVFPAKVDGKVHKRRSGPNPVGNHRLPSRQ